MKTRLRILAVKFTRSLAALDLMVLLKFPTISSLNPVVTEQYYLYVILFSLGFLFYIARLTWEVFSIVEVEIDGVRTEEAHFRGRKLQGATISLPSGYSGTFFLLFLLMKR